MTPTSLHPDTAQLGRRSLVRAGVTAAWAVPAVTVVAAAPAYATCSGSPDLGGCSHGGASCDDDGKVSVTVLLKNLGGATAGLKLVVTDLSGGKLHSASAPGWSSADGGADGSTDLTLLAATQLGCNCTTSVSVCVEREDDDEQDDGETSGRASSRKDNNGGGGEGDEECCTASLRFTFTASNGGMYSFTS